MSNVAAAAPWALWTPWTATAHLAPAPALGRPAFPTDSASLRTDAAPLGVIPRPASLAPQVAAAAARPAVSKGTPMQQAQAVVAQAHAIINKLGNSATPIGEAQAGALVDVVDSTSAQLQAIAKQAGSSDPSLTSYIQSTLSDLAGARTAYAGLVSDVSKDDKQDVSAWQAADQAVLADIQAVDKSEAAAVQGGLGLSGGGGDGGS